MPLSERRPEAAWRETFRGITRVRTIFLWISYAGVIAAFYFANTWTAKLISDASGNPDLGIQAGMLIQLGGVVGTLLFAAIALKLRPRLVTLLILALGAVTFSIYGQQINHMDRALLLAPFLGVFANGGIAAFYAISPSIYPTVSRGTGVGLMIGFGRAIAILAPIGTGYVLTVGWTPAALYQFFGVVLAVSTVFCLLLDRTYRGRSENPETPDAMAQSDVLSPRTT